MLGAEADGELLGDGEPLEVPLGEGEELGDELGDGDWLGLGLGVRVGLADPDLRCAGDVGLQLVGSADELPVPGPIFPPGREWLRLELAGAGRPPGPVYPCCSVVGRIA